MAVFPIMSDMQKSLEAKNFQSKFTGKLIDPTDAQYDKLRIVFPGGISCKPALIILAQNVSDVQAAITLAREEKRELAIRSGGHSTAGYSTCDDGIVLDLRQMKAYEINSEEQTVWAEPGLTASELTKALDTQDFVLGFGDTGSVGIGGITLGGGIGFLVRKFGLTIDNLLAIDIVTADGKQHHVSADSEPDLFWALRGGGGNFGVVTRFTYKLHKLPETMGGMLFLPAEPKILAEYMELSEKAPNELSSIINVMPCPPMPFVPAQYHGKLIMMALVMYAGPASEGQSVLAPFRSLATPIADMLRPMRYKDIFFPEDGSYHPLAISQTLLMDTVDMKTATLIFDQLNASDASMRAVQLRYLGGAVSTVSEDATAYAHRSSRIVANVATFYTGETDKTIRANWVKETSSLLTQQDKGAYVGFLGAGNEQVTIAYPPSTLARLRKVKRSYDPENFFHLNLNITPEM